MSNKNSKISPITSPETQIKWMCFDIFITTDKQVVNQSFELVKERLVSGSYGYTVSGVFRSKKWINKNSINVLGFIEF